MERQRSFKSLNATGTSLNATGKVLWNLFLRD